MPKDDDKPSWDYNPRRKLTVTTPPPSRVEDSLFKEEVTPVVTKQEVAWNEIAQMSKNVRNLVKASNNQAEYVKQIPEIKRDVKDAKRSANAALQKVDVVNTRLSTEFKSLDRRVEKVEDRGHDCAQIAVIATLQEDSLEARRKFEKGVKEDVKTGERLDSTRKDLAVVDKKVESMTNVRRNFYISLIAVFVFIASTIGSLIWFLSALDTRVEAEQSARRESYKRLEVQLKEMGKQVDPAPVQKEIKTLRTAVETVGATESVEGYCSKLSEYNVQRMKRALPRAQWPRCKRFGYGVE